MTESKLPKIAIIGSRGIPAKYGGFETFAEELALRLVTEGVDVTVYCESEPTVEQPSSFHGINLVYLPAPACGALTTILFDLLCLWHARKAYDVVYMLGYGAAPFCFIPRLWGSTVWLNVDGIEWQRSKWSPLAQLYFRAMEWFSLRTPNRVIADAEAIHDHLRRRHQKQTPCTVIPYGAPLVDPPPLQLLNEWGLAAEDYYLVVCRLEPENHVLEMLDGFTRSTSRHKLVVVGNHRSGTAYVNALLDNKDPRIVFLGTVFDKERLQALRCHARAYCHGHSVGGTNPSLLEALGCGNAVLAHDNPFNREVAADAACYFSTAIDFTVQIDRLECDDLGRKRMQSAAKSRIVEKYTWEKISAAYLALLNTDHK